MKHGTVIAMTVQQMTCTGCGAEANASCNCGKPYVPKKQRAIDAIKANPEKSNRAIAEELGVNHRTVNDARNEIGGEHSPPEREGRDGKVYHLPVREVEPDAPRELKESFFSLVDMALRISELDLSGITPTPKIRQAMEGVITAWTEAQRRMK